MTHERRPPLLAAVAAAMALAPLGPARAGEGSGLSLGVRVAYGLPLGQAMSGVSLGDVVSGQIPVQLDADWRFDRSWRAGLYLQYGFATLADAFCPAGAGCSGQNVRAGVQTAYAFAVQGSRPWVGVGVGVEWQRASVSQTGIKNELHLFGLELLNLQMGWDFRPASGFALGPFASFSLGQYRTASSGGASENLTAAIHDWLQLGVRGAFDL